MMLIAEARLKVSRVHGNDSSLTHRADMCVYVCDVRCVCVQTFEKAEENYEFFAPIQYFESSHNEIRCEWRL